MTGYLVLDSGEIFPGQISSGSDRVGEVVFNTSHSGYEEIATDPSYLRQIVVMTAPMQGNYGISDEVWESRKVWIEGFICVQMQKSKSNHSWQKRLQDLNVPILADVDTRQLVLKLRSQGTPLGALVQAADENSAKQKAQSLFKSTIAYDPDWVFEASRKQIEIQKGEDPKGPKMAILDFGSKENILRLVRKTCSEVHVFPSRTSPEQILKSQPDGLLLNNGPGDPSEVKVATQTVQSLIGKLPIFGICMGHQILALALGAKTYKMKFGHRGSNHPIRDTLLNQVYMTSQNHGYAVQEDSLPKDIVVTQRNLNDQTVAGFYSEQKKLLGIQYHPESCPGPHDSQGLFQFFINLISRKTQ